MRVWSGWFEEFFASLAGVFGSVERRGLAMAYLKALIAPVERKNGWQIAEHIGYATPDRVQWFLARSTWLADQLRDGVALSWCSIWAGRTGPWCWTRRRSSRRAGYRRVWRGSTRG
ncbi:hypothetical protein [Streptomyces djakartensis]|uniref:hypothetical protein n=1 Tax=Streptomyces djakartensis TaxID=68193 RepID=UPI0034DFDE8F